jgi:hypothetical protein
MTARGVVMVAFGDNAHLQARYAAEELRESNPDLPLQLVHDADLNSEHEILFRPYRADLITKGGQDFKAPVPASRWAKLNADVWSDFDQFVYLDADTRAREGLGLGFEVLDAGFDMVITPSANQGCDLFWHVGEKERLCTLEHLGEIVQLQAGVMWVKKNDRTARLFETWRREWLRWRGQDQAAFMRALFETPVKLWLLGRPWNGGAAIAHLFGKARA